jgi:hypothetical protein
MSNTYLCSSVTSQQRQSETTNECVTIFEFAEEFREIFGGAGVIANGHRDGDGRGHKNKIYNSYFRPIGAKIPFMVSPPSNGDVPRSLNSPLRVPT